MKKILTFTLVWCSACCAAQEQLTQVQTTSDPIGSLPTLFYAFNNTAFFLAAGDGTGREIWKSDGLKILYLSDLNVEGLSTRNM